MAGQENVQFKTVDGLTLRGLLYPASQKGPAIIMTPGVSPPNHILDSYLGDRI